ncbi:MAG: CHC2 zinc finger domain-containing protein, partial [Syntrophobacteria bacterium]
MGRINREIIEEVRAAANIVDVVGSYVPLRKRGKNYLGLCPFHG